MTVKMTKEEMLKDLSKGIANLISVYESIKYPRIQVKVYCNNEICEDYEVIE